MKQKISDFAVAFVLTVTAAALLAIVSQSDAFGGAFSLDVQEGTLSLFGVEYKADRTFWSAADKVLAFNDNLFGKGFYALLKKLTVLVFSTVADGVKLLYFCTKMLVGAV